MKKPKKIISIIMAGVLSLSLLPFSAFALSPLPEDLGNRTIDFSKASSFQLEYEDGKDNALKYFFYAAEAEKLIYVRGEYMDLDMDGTMDLYFDGYGYISFCENESSIDETITITLPGLVHDSYSSVTFIFPKWGEPEYEWAEDYSTATARRVCLNNPERIEEETVETTYFTTGPESGYGTFITIYKANFENPAFETQETETYIHIDPGPIDIGGRTFDFRENSFAELGITNIDKFAFRNFWGMADGNIIRIDMNYSENYGYIYIDEDDIPDVRIEAPYYNCPGISICPETKLSGEITLTLPEKIVDCWAEYYSYVTFIFPEKEEAWSEPEYLWAEDYSTVTARRYNLNNPDWVEEETVKSIKGKDVFEPDYTIWATFTAEFENPAFEKQSERFQIGFWDPAPIDMGNIALDFSGDPLLPLKYMGWDELSALRAFFDEAKDAKVLRAQDHGSDEYIFLDDDELPDIRIGDYFNEMEAFPISKIEGDFTVKLPGPARGIGGYYYSSVTFMFPHRNANWSEPEYIWAEDYSTVTARRFLLRDPNVVQEETVETTCEKIPAPGGGYMITYTAAFGLKAFKVQTIEFYVSDDWSEPEYEWAKDYSTVTARRFLLNDPAVVEEETVKTVYEKIPVPGNENHYQVVYIAKFENPAFETQIMKVHGPDIPPYGFGITVIGGEWYGEDGKGLASKVITIVADKQSEFKKWSVIKGNIEIDDYFSPHATFLNPFESVEIEAVYEESLNEHVWDSPEYMWAEDYSKALASRTCLNHAECTETELVKTTASDKVYATGNSQIYKIEYTAVFQNRAFGTRTKTVYGMDTIKELREVYPAGDANNDGKINAVDKAVLNRYLAGWEGYKDRVTNKAAVDFNNDGKVNGVDKAILNRYLAGWEGYEKYFEYR